MFEKAIAIDLGTTTVSVYVQGRGIVLEEPALAAVDRVTGALAAIGRDAERRLERPGDLALLRPIRDSAIADADLAERMIRRCLKKALGGNPFKPNVVFCVPSDITAVEERALRDAGMRAGARRVRLIEAPVAAALGAGLDITGPTGHMVADIGGGTCDAAVLSLGSITESETSRAAGERFDEALRRHLRRKANLLIGEQTAMDVRHRIGCILPRETNETCTVQGRDASSGFPHSYELTSEETRDAYAGVAEEIAETILAVLEHTSAALADDIRVGGVLLTGGCSLLFGLDRFLAEKTGLPVTVAEDPASCAVRGAGAALACFGGGGIRFRRPPAQKTAPTTREAE